MADELVKVHNETKDRDHAIAQTCFNLVESFYTLNLSWSGRAICSPRQHVSGLNVSLIDIVKTAHKIMDARVDFMKSMHLPEFVEFKGHKYPAVMCQYCGKSDCPAAEVVTLVPIIITIESEK